MINEKYSTGGPIRPLPGTVWAQPNTTDYHQKKISEMTDGELRAYRRELERTAFSIVLRQDYNKPIEMLWERVDQMIDRERQVEGGAE